MPVMSKVTKIDYLRFRQMKKGEIRGGVKRIMCLSGKTDRLAEFVAEMDDGTILTSSSALAKYSIMGTGEMSASAPILRGLQRLGVITADELSEHFEAVRAREQARDKNWAIKRLENVCKDLGIPVPSVPDV